MTPRRDKKIIQTQMTVLTTRARIGECMDRRASTQRATTVRPANTRLRQASTQRATSARPTGTRLRQASTQRATTARPANTRLRQASTLHATSAKPACTRLRQATTARKANTRLRQTDRYIDRQTERTGVEVRTQTHELVAPCIPHKANALPQLRLPRQGRLVDPCTRAQL